MFIKEVCRKCGLTKKAVEYYERKGLISPKIESNGYRNYSVEDVSTLKEIAVLRKLGLSIAEIKEILTSTNKSAVLAKVKYQMDLETEKATANIKCLEHLIKNYDIEQAQAYIEENIEKHFTIKEKLLQAFPGGYGMYLCVHFGSFLNEKIDTEEKERAYKTIVDYLDKIQETEFPKELEEFWQQGFGQLEEEKLHGAILEAVQDVDAYIKENKAVIEKYFEYINSEEYKKSPAYKMKQLFVKFQQESGYNEIFIENLKILSESYREYFEKLQAANKVFLEKYPYVDNIYRA